MSDQTPNWLAAGTGNPPTVGWAFATDAPLADVRLAGESGQTLAADISGGLYLLNRDGRIAAVSRGFKSLSAVDFSECGRRGVACVSGSSLCLFDRRLKVRWSTEMADEILAVAVDPHGHYVAASLAGGKTVLLDARKGKMGEYRTARPLRHLRFVVGKPALVGAAEYGLLCAHRPDGAEIWDARLWSNVGDLYVSGDGTAIILARFNQGVQQLDGQGENRGSYLVEGTPNHVSAGFVPHRLAVSTVERDLYWIGNEGELLWATSVPEDVCAVRTDPLGKAVICGFHSGHIYRLQWYR